MSVDRLAMRRKILEADGRCACEAHRPEFVAVLPPVPACGWDLSRRFVPPRYDALKHLLEAEHGISTCALSLWWSWSAFLELPVDWCGAYGGGAFVREQRYAARFGALHSFEQPSHVLCEKCRRPWDFIAPSDVLMTTRHVMQVVESVPELGFLDTIEGGQECWAKGADHQQKGLQAIARHHRAVRLGKFSWEVSQPCEDSPAQVWSPLYKWIDVSALPAL